MPPWRSIGIGLIISWRRPGRAVLPSRALDLPSLGPFMEFPVSTSPSCGASDLRASPQALAGDDDGSLGCCLHASSEDAQGRPKGPRTWVDTEAIQKVILPGPQKHVK